MVVPTRRVSQQYSHDQFTWSSQIYWTDDKPPFLMKYDHNIVPEH